jgi:hypothetical protein
MKETEITLITTQYKTTYFNIKKLFVILSTQLVCFMQFLQ